MFSLYISPVTSGKNGESRNKVNVMEIAFFKKFFYRTPFYSPKPPFFLGVKIFLEKKLKKREKRKF